MQGGAIKVLKKTGVCIILISFSACSGISGNVKDSGTGSNAENSGVISGIRRVERVYWTGKKKVLMRETTIVGGKLNGPHRTYYRNGNIEEDSYYIDNKLHGISRTYYENGNLKKEEYYKEGILDGLCTLYCENGKMKGKINYVNGQVEGRVERYFMCTGNIAEITHYKNSVIDENDG